MESTPLMKDEQPPPSVNPSYPPNPPGYQQTDYPPQPQGYPPQHPGYPPQQPGYPPQQPGYPPQQPGYPPQQPGYPPPEQPGYPPQPHSTAHHTTVITQPVVTLQSVKFTDAPVQLRCNTCQQDVVTNRVYTAGVMTWLVVGILFILGIWPCCLIPLCVDSLKDVDHVCPNCGAKQGTYKRLS